MAVVRIFVMARLDVRRLVVVIAGRGGLERDAAGGAASALVVGAGVICVVDGEVFHQPRVGRVDGIAGRPGVLRNASARSLSGRRADEEKSGGGGEDLGDGHCS